MAESNQADPAPAADELPPPRPVTGSGILPLVIVEVSVKEGKKIPKSSDDLDVKFTLDASEDAWGGKAGVERLVRGKETLFSLDLTDPAKPGYYSSVYTFDSSESPKGAWKWDLMNSLEVMSASKSMYPVRLMYRRIGFVPGVLDDKRVNPPGFDSANIRPKEPTVFADYPVFDSKFNKTGVVSLVESKAAKKSQPKPRKSARGKGRTK